MSKTTANARQPAIITKKSNIWKRRKRTPIGLRKEFCDFLEVVVIVLPHRDIYLKLVDLHAICAAAGLA